MIELRLKYFLNITTQYLWGTETYELRFLWVVVHVFAGLRSKDSASFAPWAAVSERAAAETLP